MSVVLVASGRRSSSATDAALWAELRSAAADAANGRPAAERRTAENVTVVAVPATAEDVERALQDALSGGADEVAVLPVDVAMEATPRPDDALAAVAGVVAEVAARHPESHIRSIGPPFDPEALAAVVDLLRGSEPGSGEDAERLVPAVLQRAFDDDPAVLAGFLGALRAGLPPETRIVLRGSSVAGTSYNGGLPFDSRGAGTSDLDVVVLGEAAMDLWVPEAFYFPGVNTLPLADDMDWVAPPLAPARVQAQSIVGRPVAVQAMAPWFLELRAALQGQPYLMLHAPA